MNAADLRKIAVKSEEVAGLFKLLAHPTRLKILCHLLGGEKTVSELIELCQGSQVAISQFLAGLKAEGLVRPRREGQFTYYSIADERVRALIHAMKEIFC